MGLNCNCDLPTVRNGGTPLNRYRKSLNQAEGSPAQGILNQAEGPSVQGITGFRQRGLLYRGFLHQEEEPSVSSPAMTAPIVTRGRNKTLPPGLRTTPMISSGICPAPFPDWNLASRAVME